MNMLNVQMLTYHWRSLFIPSDLFGFIGGLEILSKVQWCPAKLFTLCNFSGYNAPKILIFDIFQQIFPLAAENCPKFKDWAIFDQVMKEILTETRNKANKFVKNSRISVHAKFPPFSLFLWYTIYHFLMTMFHLFHNLKHLSIFC